MITTPRSSDERRVELLTDIDGSSTEETPIRVLRRAVRGRWRMVCVLSAVLAALGGITGAVVKPAKYESRGLLRIDQPASPLVDRRDRPDPVSLEAFIASQVQLVQSRTILDDALAHPTLRDAGWPGGDEGIAILQRALDVQRGRRENLIRVAIVHPDPRMAETAVNAILTTIATRRVDTSDEVAARAEALEQLASSLETRLDELRRTMLSRSDHYGYDAIERMHAERIEQLLTLDRTLGAVRSAASTSSSAAPAPARPTPVSPLLQRQIELQATRAMLSARFLPAHPVMRGIERELEKLRYERTLHEHLATAGDQSLPADARAIGAPAAGPPAPGPAVPTYADRDQLRAEVEALSRKRMELSALQDQIDADRRTLLQTRNQLDEVRLSAERSAAGRVSIAIRGERPVVPRYDHRATLAAGGALFGAMSGFMVVFLIGVLDRRVRFVDELMRSVDEVPVIGVLPDLDRLGGRQPRRATDAVRELRSILELNDDADTGRVIAVTGCARGEGRTSIVLSLGASFAAAGQRTLLIDADHTHPALSRTMSTDSGPDTETLDAAGRQWRLARSSQSRVWTMSMRDPVADDSGLSRTTLHDVLESARARFDVILIDTGPVSAGGDAPTVAGVADRVIVTVDRGASGALVASAIARLELFGAPLAGIVFNRAHASEWRDERSERSTIAAPVTIESPTAPAVDNTGPLPEASAAGEVAGPFAFELNESSTPSDEGVRRRAA